MAVKKQGVFKFAHNYIHGNAQPIGTDGILMTITGNLSINNQSNVHKFIETLIIRKNGKNSFVVTNTIFKLAD